MATSHQVIADTYPLQVYNYRVTIDSTTIAFSEISGLAIEYEKVIYKDGLSFLMGYDIMRGQQQQVHVTMKRGVVKGDDSLYDWMDFSILERILQRTRKDITIDLCDDSGKAIVRWKVIKAIPMKFEAPTFNASSNEVAIESMELFAQGLTIEYL